jgi:hypothetical protein
MVKKGLEIWPETYLFPNPRSLEISPCGHSPSMIDVRCLALNVLCFDISTFLQLVVVVGSSMIGDRHWTFLYQPTLKPSKLSPHGFGPSVIGKLRRTLL